MAILNSKQLWQERSRLSEAQRTLVDDGKADEALVVEGQIKQLDITIEHVIDEEDRLRSAPAPAQPEESFSARVLGPRNEFRGLSVGFKNAVVTVGAPTEIDLEIPAKLPSLLDNFASTIAETPAMGSVSFKQRSTQTGTPDTWAGVTAGTSATKAQVIYSYKDAVANKETIAGYVPVSKDSLADYDELASIIENDLLIDLGDNTDARYLTGSNSTGIIGVTNTTGIIAYADASAGKYFDAIRRMRTKVMTTSRRIPTHVCINPLIKQEIDLYKTETGLYQTLGSDVYWGMKVVEDTNCPGILVYDAFAARRRAIHGGTTVEVGYYNDQFIKNELSILAEHTKALQVVYPDAFAYATKTDLDKTTA